MHAGILYYREGWNAGYEYQRTSSRPGCPYRDKYPRDSWELGFADSQIVYRLTNQCGQYWRGIGYIHEPRAVRLLMVIGAVQFMTLIGLLYAWAF